MLYYRSAGHVVEAFHQSDSFVRGLRGPVGCLSNDTEYLTSTGWARFDEYKKGRIAQWNEKSKRISFVQPVAYIKEPCDEFIHFYNRHSMSMVLSEEHRMPMYDYRDRLVVKTAVDAEGIDTRYTLPINFRVPYSDYPISDSKLRLMVAFHADGHIVKGGITHSISLRKERKKKRLLKLLDESCVEHGIDTFPNRPTEIRYKFKPPIVSKKYTEWCWSLSERQLEIVIDEMQHWDGLYEGSDYRFCSTDKDEADFIQYAVHAIGGRATISTEVYDKPNWNDCYIVHIARPSSYKSTVMLNPSHVSIERIPSQDGFKYCFEVPTGFFVARHNGRIFVTGNSSKTVACCSEIVRRAGLQVAFRNVRHSRWALIRNTYSELLDTTLQTWNDWFGDYSIIDRTPPMRGKFKLQLKDKTLIDLELYFIALDKPKDVKKLKSLELTGIFINEAVELDKAILDMGTLRCRRYPSKRKGGPTWSGVIMDTNSCDDDHWWYKLFEEEKPKGYEVFDQPAALIQFKETEKLPAKVAFEEYLHANPDYPEVWRKKPVTDYEGNIYIVNPFCENIDGQPAGEDYWLDAVHGKDTYYIEVFLCNRFGTITDSRPVYPEFNDDRHVARKNYIPSKELGITIGMDFGNTPAATFSQITPGGYKHLFEEFYVPEHGQMGIRQFSRTVLVPYLLDNYLPWLQRSLIKAYGDPSGKTPVQTDEKTCFILLREVPATGNYKFFENAAKLNDPAWVKKLKVLAKDPSGKVSFADIGIDSRPAKTQSLIARRDAVVKYLIGRIDGKPAWQLSPRCTLTRKAMRGKYRYKRVQISGEKRYHDDPVKDLHSHVAEAHQYDCLMSEFQAVDTSAEEDQAEQEHRKDIGNAACAAWDEVARVKAEVEAEWLGEDEWDEDDEWYDENFHGG